MASWLKVAEDLFEVVDRRAKLVASDLSEEQSDSQPSASKGKEPPKGKRKSNVKAQRRPSISVSSDNNDVAQEHVREQKLADIAINSSDSTPASETSGTLHVDLAEKASIESPSQADAGSSKITSSETKTDPAENVDAISSSIDRDYVVSDNKAEDEKSSSLQSETAQMESLNTHHNISATADSNLLNADNSSGNDGGVPENYMQEMHVNQIFQGKQTDALEPPKTEQEAKSVTSDGKVQDQLDEAQGLLESTNSTGQSKEARLARVCAGLSTRLQEYKSENAQLEELLTAERELSSSYETRMKQLQHELSESRKAVGKIELNLTDSLAAKNSEIEALQNAMDGLKKQTADSEGKLASLQADMETITRSRELTETRMMQALREELASAERRAEEERTAHNATKMTAMEREVELERRAVETSTALARIQRTLDERTSKAADLEQKLALLEVECASLTQELQDMETRARHGEKRSPEEANQMLKIQAWQEEVERARQGQRDAESKLSNMEADLQKMRVEMASMKRDAEHYSRQEHMELEKRYRELTDLLYYKQTQLEAMASEKAAAEFQLEKEAKRFQEAQVEAERNRTSRRASSSWEEENDLKSLESLPLHHRHMVGASIQLQKAVKLIDSGAVRATRFLWRYPVARVILVFYMVFVHFFLMYLLHRLQEQADSFAAKEVAASMGLANSNIP